MIQRDMTPQDYMVILRRRWVLITVLTVIGAPLAYGISRFLPNEYKSQTLVLVEQPTVPTDFVKEVDTEDITQRLAGMEQEILSRTRLEPVIRQFGLYSEDINRLPMEDLVARLQKQIVVTPVMPMAQTQSKILPGFFISVTLDNARTAQQVCTTVTSMFIEENVRQRQQQSEDTTAFLAQQLSDAKAKLDEQDSKLAAFESKYIGSLPDEERGNVNILMTLNSQLEATSESLARAQQDKGFAQSVLSQQISAWQASQTGHNPETLEQQLAALQTQLANLEASYTDDYPDVIQTKNDIAALKKRIAEKQDQTKVADANTPPPAVAEPGQITQLRGQIHNYDQDIASKEKEEQDLKQQIKTYQARVASSPAVEEEYKQLTRDYNTALGFYNDLLKKRDTSAMATDLERRQEGEQFRVLDPANLPDEPTFPNRPLFAAGGAGGGLFLGMCITFLLELKDTSLKSERDVEAILHLPVLAVVPALEPVTAKGKVRVRSKKKRAGGPPQEETSVTAEARA